MAKPDIQIWTDGACSGNPGPGGWGVLLIAGDKRKELYGGDPDTTNNRMELMGAIEGLSVLKNCPIRSHSVSHWSESFGKAFCLCLGL